MTKRLTKILQSVAIIVLIMLVALIAILFGSCKKENSAGSKFYLVYASNTQNVNAAEALAKDVEQNGGAGNIYIARGAQFVVVSTYCTMSDAKIVAENIKNKYQNTGILEFDCTIKKNAKSLLNSNNIAKNYYKTLLEMCIKLSDYSIKYDKNLVDLHQIYKLLIRYRQQFVSFANGINDKKTDDFVKVKASINLIISYIDSFYSSVFSSSFHSVQIKKLLAFAAIEAYEIKNLL